MKTAGRNKIIIAAAIVATLAFSNVAQASNFFVSEGAAERPVGLFEQAATWLTEAWSHLTGIFAEDSTNPIPQTCSDETSCGDSGWGIDPEG